MEDKIGEEGDFLAAIERFTEAITLNRNNHQLFSQRSAAYARIGKFNEALEDAKRCYELKPDWPKAYHRLGVAYQGLGHHDDAVIAFAEGLAADPKQTSVLGGLIDAMLKSPLKGNFQPKLEKFESLKLDRNPFIITSIVGQELLSASKLEPAMKVLEAARIIGTDSMKLEASLLQALGKVHWTMKNTERALEYMENDLKIRESLGDHPGILRALDNLGIAYSSVGRYDDAIRHHTHQLEMAQSLSDTKEMINALQRLGSAFSKISVYQQALKAYKDAFRLSQDINDEDLMSQGFSNVAQTHIMLGDIDRAIQWYHQQLQFAKDLRNKSKEAEAHNNLGQTYQLKGNYDQSMMFYQQLLSVAVRLNNLTLKAQAYGGMGQANRAMNNLVHAQSCREQQLKICQDINDEEGQLVALTHLGHVHRAGNKLSQAMHYYTESLKMAQQLGDKGGEAKAYSSLGSCHLSLGNIREAVNYYNQELAIVEEKNDRVSQANAHGQLGIAYLSLEDYELACKHLKKSLELSEQLKDKRLVCSSESNLGHYHTIMKEFHLGLDHLEHALRLSQELKDLTTESKVCHDLGLCHEGLGNYRQAIQYFQHDFMVAKEAQDKEGLTLACEKLVKAHTETGDREQADVYRRKMAVVTEEIQSSSGKCTFWNQMAEDTLNMGDYEKAIEYYANLLKEAKKEQHQSFEGLAYRGLGNAHLSGGNYEHALSYFQHDVAIRKAAGDLTGECDAYSNMGAAHNSLGNHQAALECFEHQLALARQLDNPVLITKAYGCLGIVHRNTQNFTNALHYHQLQLTTALTLEENDLEQAGAYANLGDSYEAIQNYLEAVKNHEHHLLLSQKAQNELLQIRALGSLGRAHRGLGSIRKALGYFQQRLKLSREISDEYIEAECYADIGSIYMLLRDYTQASEAYTNQLEIAKRYEDCFSEALASCGLGEVQYRLGNYPDAIEHHLYDLDVSTQNELLDGKARAFGNIADTYEAMRDYHSAIAYREKQLSVADTLRNPYIRAVAFMGLGKTYLHVGDFQQAVSLLKQALGLTVRPNGYDTGDKGIDIEVEAKIRFYLGQAFYHIGHHNDSMVCLQKSLPLFEQLRDNIGHYDHSSKQTLELLPILYQTLICVLVKLNKVEEALEMAERERNRALVEYLLERDVNRPSMKDCGLMKPFAPRSSWIQEAINTIHCPVLYYCIALNHVFIWLLHPKTGIVQFKRVDMTDLALSNTSDNASIFSENSSTYVQPLTDSITALREMLGVDAARKHYNKSTNSSIMSDDSSEDTESIISLGDQLSSSPASSSSRSPNKGFTMQPVHELYELLIHPVECALPHPTPGSPYRGQVIVIPDKDLYLVPFALLKGEGNQEFMYQQFHLRFAPSLQTLISERKTKSNPVRKKSAPLSRLQKPTEFSSPNSSSRIPLSHSPTNRSKSPSSRRSQDDKPVLPKKPLHLVVGNPSVPISPSQCTWQPIAGVEKEVKLVSDLLDAKPLLGSHASKEQVLKLLPEAQSVYFGTNVSWTQSQIVLAATDVLQNGKDDFIGSKSLPRRLSGDGAPLTRRGLGDGSSVEGMPEPGEYLLSLSDLMDAKLKAKLVVISAAHRTDSSSRITAEGLMVMAEGILASGAECVLIPLWPATHQGSRLMMNAFFSSLLYGSRASRALSYAMQLVNKSQKYGHPANWSGYMLLGKDIILRDRAVDLARSLRSMLQAPQDYLIAGLKTLQAMIVTSLKHLAQGQSQTEPKIASRSTIESKVGSINGWEELLTCNGFHFISPLKKDMQSTIVFPEHDDSGLQKKTHRSIEALLGLPSACLKSFSILCKHPSIARPLLAAIRSGSAALSSSHRPDTAIEIQLEREVWQVEECSTLFHHLGFSPNVKSTQTPWIILQAPAKQLELKLLQYATTATLAVFGPEEYLELPPQKMAIYESELL